MHAFINNTIFVFNLYISYLWIGGLLFTYIIIIYN